MFFDQNFKNERIKVMLEDLESKRVYVKDKKKEIKKFSFSSNMNNNILKVLNNTLKIDMVDSTIRQHTLIKFLIKEQNTTICETIVRKFQEIFETTSSMVEENFRHFTDYSKKNKKLNFESFPIISNQKVYENYYRLNCISWSIFNTKFLDQSLDDSAQYLNLIHNFTYQDIIDLGSDRGTTKKASLTCCNFLKSLPKSSTESKCLYISKKNLDEIIEKNSIEKKLENSEYFRFSYMKNGLKRLVDLDKNNLLLEIFIGINMRDQRRVMGHPE